MISTRLKGLLEQSGIRFEVVTHDPAFTAQHLAARMHVPGREFVKAVVVHLDDRQAIAAVPAHRRVDEKALAGLAGARRCTLATEAEFRELFPDCELGAMPPVGNLYGLDTYVDEEVTRDESVVVNAGTHAEAVRLRYADLARLAKPTVGRFGVPPPSEIAARRKPPRAKARRPARATAGASAAGKPARAKAARRPSVASAGPARKPARKKVARKKAAARTGGKKSAAKKKAPRTPAKRRQATARGRAAGRRTGR